MSMYVRKFRYERFLARNIGYLGIATLPLASFVLSYIQQLILKMAIAGVKLVNGVVKDVIKKD